MARLVNLYDYLRGLDNNSTLTFVKRHGYSAMGLSKVFSNAMLAFPNMTVSMQEDRIVQTLDGLRRDKNFFVFETLEFDPPRDMAQRQVSQKATSLGMSLVEASINFRNVRLDVNRIGLCMNTAFEGIKVAVGEQVEANEKNELKMLIEAMGGVYMDKNLTSSTHLIAISSKTQMYSFAYEKKLPIYHLGWVRTVFETTSNPHNCHMKATDENFDYCLLPVFSDMQICVDFLQPIVKEEIRTLIIKNNGCCQVAAKNVFSNLNVYAVIVDVNFGDRAIIEASNESNIPLLTLQWIYDCVEAKHALKPEPYRVKPYPPFLLFDGNGRVYEELNAEPLQENEDIIDWEDLYLQAQIKGFYTYRCMFMGCLYSAKSEDALEIHTFNEHSCGIMVLCSCGFLAEGVKRHKAHLTACSNHSAKIAAVILDLREQFRNELRNYKFIHSNLTPSTAIEIVTKNPRKFPQIDSRGFEYYLKNNIFRMAKNQRKFFQYQDEEIKFVDNDEKIE